MQNSGERNLQQALIFSGVETIQKQNYTANSIQDDGNIQRLKNKLYHFVVSSELF
jgi:hypothetical protein